LNVEARQPHRRRRHEQEARGPAEAAERGEAPLEGQDRGAMPNEMMSAMESNSTPNSLVVPVNRAMRPSSMSRITAKPMKGAAVSYSPRIA
jgi:hypothetical protein